MKVRRVAAPLVALLLGLALCLAGCAADATPVTKPAQTSTDETRGSTPRSTSSATRTSAAPDVQPRAAWRHREVSVATLQTASRARWFFAHQSIGGNVLKGVKALYKANSLPTPAQVSLDQNGAIPSGGGFIAETHIGRNGHPFEKLADFDATLRAGLVGNVDVAVLKFCYADIRSGRVDVDQLFQEYRRIISGLERDYPKVTFIYATAALKADTPADNVARSRFNGLVRAEYAKSGRLWDLAAIESTTPDGEQVGGMFEGQTYEALYPGFTRDGGHLYDIGTEVAAAPLLELIAKALR